MQGGEPPRSPVLIEYHHFVGVTGPDAESVPGGALMVGAYAVVWVLLFLFLLRMRGLQRHTAEELERLSAEIRATEAR